MIQKRKMLRPLRFRIALILYQILLHAAIPLLLAKMLLRSRKEPIYRHSFLDRLGLGVKAPSGAVWIYAVSLGETRAVSPLVDRLLDQGHHVLMTHGSPAGLLESKRLFQDAIEKGQLSYGYMAVDFFWAVALFLKRNRPRVGLIVEYEIWPEMLSRADRSNIPMFQVNGNVADRSIERDQNYIGRVRLLLYGAFDKILTKSEAYRRRYLRAGALDDQIELVGELKFDQWIDPVHLERANEIRENWPGLTVMFASTVEAEEAQILTIVQSLRSMTSPPRIIWVPRSPQRFDEVAKVLENNGTDFVRRSQSLSPDLKGTLPDTGVILGDSIGEMNFYYQLSDIVFVGASLVPHGGHNIIEPLALGRPVVMGPSIHGITFPAVEAIESGAMESYPNSETLTDRLHDLVENKDKLASFTKHAQEFNSNYTGSAERSMTVLAPYLEAS